MGIIFAFANDGELSFTNMPNQWELVASNLNTEDIILQSRLVQAPLQSLKLLCSRSSL